MASILLRTTYAVRFLLYHTPAHGQPLFRGVFLTDLPGSKNCDIIQIRAYHNCDSRGEANARKTVRKTLNRNRMDRDRKHSSSAACGVRRVLSAVGNNRFIFARRVRRVHRVCAHPHNAARVRSEKVQTLYPALYPDGTVRLRAALPRQRPSPLARNER